SPRSVVGIAVIVVMAVIHLRGVGPGRLVSNVLAALKVTAFVLFIALGFAIGEGQAANFTQAAVPVAPAGFLLALVAVGFTYSGWHAAAYIAGEILYLGRHAPR